MSEALARVKAALGGEAIILGTRTIAAPGLRGLAGGQRVEITAALPDAESVKPAAPAESGRPVPARHRGEYERLTAAAVSDQLARRILAGGGLPGVEAAAGPAERFQQALARLVPTAGGIRLQPRRATCVALLGPAGAGKTTTAAKLAAEFVLRRGKQVALVSLDLHGVGRHEQLARYAGLIGARHAAPQSLDAARALLPELTSCDLILLDTSGLSPSDADRRDQLAEMLDVFRPEERHLVLPASMDAAVQGRLAEFFAALTPNRLLLTRTDEALGMGVVLNAAERLSLALSYTSGGQTVPHDLAVASAENLARAIGLAGRPGSAGRSGAYSDVATDRSDRVRILAPEGSPS